MSGSFTYFYIFVSIFTYCLLVWMVWLAWLVKVVGGARIFVRRVFVDFFKSLKFLFFYFMLVLVGLLVKVVGEPEFVSGGWLSCVSSSSILALRPSWKVPNQSYFYFALEKP